MTAGSANQQRTLRGKPTVQILSPMERRPFLHAFKKTQLSSHSVCAQGELDTDSAQNAATGLQAVLQKTRSFCPGGEKAVSVAHPTPVSP